MSESILQAARLRAKRYSEQASPINPDGAFDVPFPDRDCNCHPDASRSSGRHSDHGQPGNAARKSGLRHEPGGSPPQGGNKRRDQRTRRRAQDHNHRPAL
ncbi:hypothetical protein CBM2586_B10383 [Cupriavidus phytorum]|uniref:Uncharacterized protein n=1 Tax=Cupriavidus taiwanensis TaxID=164546 RepID=A0A375DNB2_9BURK|nr:hypothetical protein CBM2586_B10383 [Cupriavidus taiwanensis]SOZ08913.1 protein of unknown function [Cupriavidus taiwanensis]SOZ11209.1 protein of unknown function [Cupriavidus taiwanensis]SOZ42559.1 protein of unknown function [Cupriavidus taiwanensis]SPC21572.1 protein of unknown function [Cupriavidus taiwanensis]